MDSSDSDEDCQLYTRAAENVTLKQEQLRLPAVVNYLDSEYTIDNSLSQEFSDNQENIGESHSESDDLPPVSSCNREIPLLKVNHNKSTGRTLRSKKSKRNTEYTIDNSLSQEFSDNQENIGETHSESDDLHSVSSCNREIPLQVNHNKSTGRTLRSKKSKRKDNNSLVNEISASLDEQNILVLDDDEEFNSLPPINFNGQYATKNTNLTDKIDISGHSSSNKESDYAVDNRVTLIVEWNNGCNASLREFKLEKYTKLGIIFENLAKLEGLPPSRVLLMHNYVYVNPEDTPSSLNLGFYGALTGSVSSTDVIYNALKMNQPDSEDSKTDDENSIKVKLQMDSNKTIILNILKDQQFSVLFKRCSEILKCEEDNLRITFDGENVRPDDIVSNLDIENEDVLHLYKK